MARYDEFDLPILSDDIWNKFELPLLGDYDPDPEYDPMNLTSYLDFGELCEIRNHDCMWAGHCGSKEHPVDEYKQVKLFRNNIIEASAMKASSTTIPGRSLLLKTQQQIRVQPPSEPPSGVESPPNSDDEEPKDKTAHEMFHHDVISECDIDLYAYLEDEDILSENIEELQTRPKSKQQHYVKELPCAANAAVVLQLPHDHCYHKDKNASMQINNLGLETPSDSEEEIDVVTIAEKQTMSNKMACTLPNKPTNRDKQHLQRKMESAINKNVHQTNSVAAAVAAVASSETTSPPRGPPVFVDHPTGRRGMKRPRNKLPTTVGGSPYKRRHNYNNSSDSEQEPLEKRNLHNNMERQRRIDLRNAFEDLRVLVPEVSVRERAPKVVILREAAAYCYQLSDDGENFECEIDELKEEQMRLRARVSQLRLSLAASKHR